jgi:hypothetical protein
MFETVSVDDAIQKGSRMVVYPRVVLFFISLALAAFFTATDRAPGWYIILGAGGGFVIGWLYWTIAVTRWRLWAFDNVRNVHELQKRAVKEGIIAEDGSFWDGTIIKTSNDRQKLDALQSKFDVPDVFLDDYEVPDETAVRYSKSKTFLGLAVGVLLLLGGITLIITTKEFFGIFLVAMGLFLGFMQYREFANNEPQIILNAEGIETASTSFCSWKDIFGEDVITEQHGKSTTHNFIYSYPDGSEDIDIGELAVTRHELENLLRVYRGRWEKKNGQHTAS